MPAQVKAQTIKQAKKSYKARGQPSLSEREVKQLERARELEVRAWRTREQEKRRVEASRRRAEKEKEDRLEQEKARLGSQRRCDRFGYQSSQFHLGKFFQVGPLPQVKEEPAPGSEVDSEAEPEAATEPRSEPGLAQEADNPTDDDDFLEDDLDDPTLLDVLDQTHLQTKPEHEIVVCPALNARTSAHSRSSCSNVEDSSTHPPAQPTNAITQDEDMANFWDELESSTQIARDLDTPQLCAARSPLSRTSSFGFDDTDLTLEDLDRLDPPKGHDRALNDRMLMPPPKPPPPHRLRNAVNRAPVKTCHITTIAPPQVHVPTAPKLRQPCSVDHGFTTSELESWVDDDLLLTQIAPG